MTHQALLDRIRTPWLSRVSRELARGAGVREAFQDQLERFYQALEQAVVTGDPAWMDAIIAEWTNAPTESDLQDSEPSVSAVLNRMIGLTSEIAREILSDSEALDLLVAVTPLFTYGLERAAQIESEVRLQHAAQELEDVKQKLERLDRTKSNFIAVAAHELKTPLTLIEGYAAMMRDAAQNGEDSSEELLRGVSTGVRRLREIVDDMIDVSLIDNSLLSLNFQPTWLHHILDLLTSDLEETVRGRKLKLIIKSFPGSEQMIFADPERLYQALRNLLTNAIKFTPDGGKITVDGRNLPGFIEIIISDTGIGISAEDQALIFEKFGQLGETSLHSSGKTKFKGGGPGLGLPIVRGIIEAHGGTIWVESPGYDEKKCPGSTFHVLLPARLDSADPKLVKLFGADKTAERGMETEEHGQENA